MIKIKKRPASAKNTKTAVTSEEKKVEKPAKRMKASQTVGARPRLLRTTRPAYRGIPGPEFGAGDLDWQIASMNSAFDE